MTDKKQTLAVRVVLGVLMTVVGAFMLAGCPVSAHPPLAPRTAGVVGGCPPLSSVKSSVKS
jgi:hypothetical protein